MSGRSGTGYVDGQPVFRSAARTPHRTAQAILEAQRAEEPPYLWLDWQEDGEPGVVRRPDHDGRMAGRAQIDPETEALRRAKIAATLRGRKRPRSTVEAMSRGMRASIIRRNRAKDRLVNYGSVNGWREVHEMPSTGWKGEP